MFSQLQGLQSTTCFETAVTAENKGNKLETPERALILLMLARWTY